MKQKKLIFYFFVNRNWKKLTDSRKTAKILADNRKGHHPIETLLKHKVKQRKNGKFTFNYKASPTDFETQISLRRLAPPNISPSKRAFEKYKPWGLFSEFYGILTKRWLGWIC